MALTIFYSVISAMILHFNLLSRGVEMYSVLYHYIIKISLSFHHVLSQCLFCNSNHPYPVATIDVKSLQVVQSSKWLSEDLDTMAFKLSKDRERMLLELIFF